MAVFLNTAILFFAIFIICSVKSQDNAGTGVAPALQRCYNRTDIPEVTSPYARPPSTINILIEYIRQLEDANPTTSAQTLSYELLQRFRQDGIRRYYRSGDDNPLVIPYSPTNLEVYRNRVLLKQMLPYPRQNLNFGDLNPLEMCSLHYMISSSTDAHQRGDENTVCFRTSRYQMRSTIIKRKRREIEQVEELASVGGNRSMCPLEYGVVYTSYGSVKAGSVLAGIATGLNTQIANGADTRYAATIGGDITEAALYQASSSIEIGANGAWNSTINPRYYFLQKNTYLHVTDAEIRGGLDGLFMGLSMPSWKSKTQDIKISQILDMYYSRNQRGVFDKDFRACNRNFLYNELVKSESLLKEVYNFMPLLDAEASGPVTKPNSSFESFSRAGTEAFTSYLPELVRIDQACPQDESNIQRVAADLLIYVDFNWAYETVQPILSFVLDSIDVNKYGSRYAIFNGQDVNNITNGSTYYISEFHELYTKDIHDRQSKGIDYTKIFEHVELYTNDKLNNNSYYGGDSSIVLIITTNTLADNQKSYIEQRRSVVDLPDLKYLVLTNGGNPDDFSSIVTNPSKDVVIFSGDTSTSEDQLKETGSKLVENIQSIPRSIVNPSCGSKFSGSSTTSTSVTQSVEPNGVNYYRISPNYFYSGGDNRYLKVRELSTGSINFCYSREDVQPTNQTGQCVMLKNSEESVDIKGFCEGSVASCKPIYISISGNSSDIKCSDANCRFPDNIKYTITLESVGCDSAGGASSITGKIFMVVAFLSIGWFSSKVVY